MECMNGMCGSSNSVEWKKGWPLRSGGFATLCLNCGIAYKELIFCETFHSEETGWRECTSCGKRLHCGCIASSPLLDLLDTGGVNCKICNNTSIHLSTPSQEQTKPRDMSTQKGINPNFENDAEIDCREYLPPSQNVDVSGSGEIGYKLLSNFNQPSKYFHDPLQESTSARNQVHKSSLVQTNLSISLSASSNSNPEERELSSAISSFQQGCRPRHLLPRIPNSILAAGLETSPSNISQLRIARPPVEGRVKNQLLPRYWPRITDQELQQISGDSNSTIVPLFEKVLSASDAGRIGRLVLPKACAEAYFPPISQPEGLPLRIQDVKGKEWVFQFRFWPNNNSRMYVLEGVTPCIQSMQLQAGDTVTFSRMDPEGKLLMGFRKASNSMSQHQDSHYAMNNGGFQREQLLATSDNVPIMSGYSGLLQSIKGNRNPSMLSKHVYTGNNLPPQQLLLPERKRSRNIGPKSKRLLMDGHDALELKLSWEEVQDMLRPPPSVEPSTISIEDYEFEEFEEPPVFGKRSIFIVRLSGEHEQWAQCDNCFKWRKLPVDFLLPPKWTCQDNVKDQTRSSCSAPDELDARELENLLRMNKDFKKRRVATSLKRAHEHEPQDQEKINTAAIGGEINEPGASSVAAATTKHPRHRPGCSCIVCIQPPSGKGKHKPTCTCNVCMTVKRRFKTLMMRKKKRQSDREAEIAQRIHLSSAAKDEAEVDSVIAPTTHVMSQVDKSDHVKNKTECESKGLLDLNCCPGREHIGTSRLSMMSLVQEASLPLDTYLRQNGLTSLVPEQQVTSPENTTQEPHEDRVLSEEDSDELSGKDQREDDVS